MPSALAEPCSLSKNMVALEKSAAFGGSGAAGASQRASVFSANFRGEAFFNTLLAVSD